MFESICAGLEYLRELTKDGPYQLRVVLEDFDGECVYAQYDSFYIDDECDGYKLHVSGFIDGGAGDFIFFNKKKKLCKVSVSSSASKLIKNLSKKILESKKTSAYSHNQCIQISGTYSYILSYGKKCINLSMLYLILSVK
uniref:Fibrinogen C-terminal domain-containing protein n=1 Tax=Salarias fasciatus TaxID=181472 RepID=A0A672G0L3_SALFA